MIRPHQLPFPVKQNGKEFTWQACLATCYVDNGKYISHPHVIWSETHRLIGNGFNLEFKAHVSNEALVLMTKGI